MRMTCLGFYLIANLGLYFLFVRYYKWLVLHAVVFLAIFASMQSSQIQLAWEALAVHSVVICIAIASYFLGSLIPFIIRPKTCTCFGLRSNFSIARYSSIYLSGNLLYIGCPTHWALALSI